MFRLEDDKKNFLNRIILIGLVVVYLVLAFKNPFSDNSLIPNLEPYPDTLLYSFPAWNWVRGNGWKMAVDEKAVAINIPNTYGYFLAPFLKLFGDIRAFYIANILLGIGTIIFFVLALRNVVTKNKFLISIYFGFLLVTNFYFFNQPQLVMTENVNYLFVSIFLYLVTLKFKTAQLIPIGILIFIALNLKQTNLVLAGGFAISFLIKIFWEKLRFLRSKNILITAGIFVITAAVFYIPKILNLGPKFGFKYFTNNFALYFSCLSGGVCRNLWYWQRMVSWDEVLIFLLGVVVMLINKKTRVLLLELLSPLILLVLAMSMFSDFEGRHVEILLPIILLVGAVAIDKLLKRFKTKLILIVIFLGINLFFTSYVSPNWEMKIVSLKKQTGLNFRHKEDPWNYLCLKMVKSFMADKKEAYFGSFLPIYFFDAYNAGINYLPLANDQDYMTRGLNKYFQLPLKNLYENKLKEGKEIYLSDYYASNGRESWKNQWNEIVVGKKIEKVYQSSMNNCNVYKLSLKNE